MELASVVTTIVAFLVGVATWSFAEYALHNWVFHGPMKKGPLKAEHVRHHATTSYFAPTSKKALVAITVVTVTGVPAYLLLGGPGLAWSVGFASFYAVYELVHRRCHTHAPRGPYSRFVRLHHFHHHFHAPDKNHGVTSPIWDHVFRTYEKPGVIRVPEKHAMDWLCDPESGEVRQQYAADYEIRRRRRRGKTTSRGSGPMSKPKTTRATQPAGA